MFTNMWNNQKLFGSIGDSGKLRPWRAELSYPEVDQKYLDIMLGHGSHEYEWDKAPGEPKAYTASQLEAAEVRSYWSVDPIRKDASERLDI